MPAPNLKNMDVDALLVLRSQIDNQLATRRSDLQKQLARLQRLSTDAAVVARNGRNSAMKGIKGKPKYRDRKTRETAAGRRVRPSATAPALEARQEADDDFSPKNARQLARKNPRHGKE